MRQGKVAISVFPKPAPRPSAARTRCIRSRHCEPNIRSGAADVARTILPTCRALGIGFVACSLLGRGFLAGIAQDLAQNDRRRSLLRWHGGALARNLGLIETLKTLVHARGFTAAQVALAWVLHKGEDIVPIPGTTQVQRLEEGIAAAAIQLAPADIAAIEAAVPENAVQGRRYDAASECWEDRERA